MDAYTGFAAWEIYSWVVSKLATLAPELRHHLGTMMPFLVVLSTNQEE
jgi:hypothetical protein